MPSQSKDTCVPAKDVKTSFQKYTVMEFLGSGSYGKVLKCLDPSTNKCVALKVMRKDKDAAFNFQKELEMLKRIKELEPDTYNLINLIEDFEDNGSHCMAFEILEQSVDEFIRWEKPTLSLNELRPMVKQLLTALLGLQTIGVIHADIKPDNIMLVNQKEHPFKVRLIDFGLAKHISQVQKGEVMQNLMFRAPEVVLGLPVCEQVDMWSLACCTLTWYQTETCIESFSEYDYMTMLVTMLGVPADELLNKGLYTTEYFVQENSKWRLKTHREYKNSTGKNPGMNQDREEFSLRDIIFEFEEEVTKDEEAFHDLMKKMFEIDAKKRITPAEALLHPFITMEHLSHGEARLAHEFMSGANVGTDPLTERMQAEDKASETIPKKDENSPFVKEAGNTEIEAVNALHCKSCVYRAITLGFSAELASCDEASNEEPIQEIMTKSPEEGYCSKLMSRPNMASECSHIAAPIEEAESFSANVKFAEVDSDQELARLIEAANIELPGEYSHILEEMKLLQDEDGTKDLIEEMKKKTPKSRLGRLWASFCQLMNPTPRPKKPFFRKPKWVKRLTTFLRRSETSGTARG